MTGASTTPNGDGGSVARTFMLVTVAGALAGWDIGFEYGAFDTISYRRVFAVFVVSTVVLAATFVADDDTFGGCPGSC